jgi:hypothetical protein
MRWNEKFHWILILCNIFFNTTRLSAVSSQCHSTFKTRDPNKKYKCQLNSNDFCLWNFFFLFNNSNFLNFNIPTWKKIKVHFVNEWVNFIIEKSPQNPHFQKLLKFQNNSSFQSTILTAKILSKGYCWSFGKM